MRFLHTSDWHLGRSLHRAPLLEEQRKMITAIANIAQEEMVDAVIIAGDIFDRAVPSVEAISLWEESVTALRLTGAQIIAISGNHDSARRLGLYNRILEPLGVAIRGSVDELDRPIRVHARASSAKSRPDKQGSDNSDVFVYAIPYLNPTMASSVLAGTDDEANVENDDEAGPLRRRLTHADITSLAMDRVRADLARRGAVRSVVVAHTFVDGGTTSESERAITLGNIENVPVDVFSGVDYVALGHLHGPQEFADGRVSYSGSPLPYSFSEEHHSKSVRIVDLDLDGRIEARTVPVDVGMRLVTIEGELDHLLTDPRFTAAESAFVRVRLTDRHQPHQPMDRLRNRFPHVLEMRLVGAEPRSDTDHGSTGTNVARDQMQPLEMLTAFFEDQEGRPAYEEEVELFEMAVAAATGGLGEASEDRQ